MFVRWICCNCKYFGCGISILSRQEQDDFFLKGILKKNVKVLQALQSKQMGGWLEVIRSAILHFIVNQRPHWAYWQYGQSGGTWGWLGVERWPTCQRHPAVQIAIGKQQWVTRFHCVCALCSVSGWLRVYTISCSQYSQTISLCGWDDNCLHRSQEHQ